MSGALRALCCLGLLMSPLHAQASDALGKSPHGAEDGCVACHAPAEGDEPAGAHLPVVETCRSCHPTADMHPVNVAPSEVTVPASFPLEGGLMACNTCHVEPAHSAEFDDLLRPWFRGGPYENIGAFCYQCHEVTAYARTNPHRAPSPYAEGDPSCAACHTVAVPRGVAPEAARLRTALPDVCSTCHPGEPHTGSSAHLYALVSDEVRAKLPASMALPADGAIQCWTCHEVHEGGGPGKVGHTRLSNGIIEMGRSHVWKSVPEDALWPGTAREHPTLLALPLEDSALCAACHGEGPR